MRSYSEMIPSLGRRRSPRWSSYLPWSSSSSNGRNVGAYMERLTDSVHDVDDVEMARGLGWVSIAIGVTELFAPHKVSELLGLKDMPQRRGTIRVLGVRELCHGVGILTENEPNHKLKAGVFSRVAGDVLDSALLGVAAAKTNKPIQFAVISAMVLGIGVADLLCSKRLAQDA
ncbi:MAG: hypothetical protein QOF78_1090 [Phycisphaerales bacterium]|nr:hypothetical protein [Phycisphaerales bacterium]